MANKVCELLASVLDEGLDDQLEMNCGLFSEGLLSLRPIDLLDISESEVQRLLDGLDQQPHHLNARSLWPANVLFDDDLWEPLALSTLGYLLSVGLSPQELEAWLEALRDQAERLLEVDVRWIRPEPSPLPLIPPLPPVWGQLPTWWLLPPGQHLDLPWAPLLSDLASISELRVLNEATSIPCLIASLGLVAIVKSKLHLLNVWSCCDSLGEPGREVSYVDFIRWCIAESVSMPPDSQLVEVLLLRSGLLSGECMTLEEIAARKGVTRERIRQIETRALKYCDPKRMLQTLVPVRLAAMRVLDEAAGSCEQGTAAGVIAMTLGWERGTAAAGISQLLTCLPEVHMANGGQVLSRVLECRTCPALGRGLLAALQNEHAAPLVQVSESVLSACIELKSSCRWSSGMSPERLVGLLESFELNGTTYSAKDDWVVSSDHDGGRVDTKVAQVLRVLRRGGTVMHFQEVHRQLCLEEGASTWSKRNVYATLERSPEAISWDTGSFVHVSHMPFPYGLLRQIEDWLVERLEGSEAVQMMSVAAAAEAFRDPLFEAGIDAELALYSLLRMSADSRLVYPRYPQVYSTANFSGRIPLTTVIEEYVRDAGQPVEIADVRGHVCGALGFKEFQFQIALADTPGILRYDRQTVVHYELVSIDEPTRERLLHRARSLIGAEGSVAVARLYQEAEVDCVLNHIGTPRLLHSLIAHWGAKGVSAGKYPTIHGGDDSPDDLTEMVLAYVRDKGAPCAMRELEEVFVEAKGYRAGSVWAVGQRDEVHRYLRGTIVHSKVIGWSPAKQQLLEQVANSELSARRAAGGWYAKVSDMIESERLPFLADHVIWTEQLIADLMPRSGRFHVLGNARNAVIDLANPEGIKTFGDLVALIVQREFGGGVGLNTLEERLERDQLILKSLTPGMLSDTERLRVDGLEVAFIGGSHDA